MRVLNLLASISCGVLVFLAVVNFGGTTDLGSPSVLSSKTAGMRMCPKQAVASVLSPPRSQAKVPQMKASAFNMGIDWTDRKTTTGIILKRVALAQLQMNHVATNI